MSDTEYGMLSAVRGDSRTKPERQQQRQRATRPLPTDRMKFDLQIKVLQTTARLSGPGRRPVSAPDLSRAVGAVVPATVILSHRFFRDCGWLEPRGRGLYAATDSLIEYSRQLAAGDPSGRARALLREPMKSAWFWAVLEPHLGEGTLAVNEALVLLMREAQASESHLPMLRNLIEWLAFVGLVEVNDERVVLAQDELTTSAKPVPVPDVPAVSASAVVSGTATMETQAHVEPAGQPAVLTFGFDLSLTAEDLGKLAPDQITALFEGVGKVMAMKHRE
jgi:hypothetical protein